jgi:hypothetical protein
MHDDSRLYRAGHICAKQTLKDYRCLRFQEAFRSYKETAHTPLPPD